MERLSYLDFFYLSLFSKIHIKKSSTIFHILMGKKTASILYNAEKYKLTNYFGLFPKLNRIQFDASIKKMKEQHYLIQSKEEEGYFLSDNGEMNCRSFFDDHYYPKQLNQLMHGEALIQFWRTIQLITQVLSEIRYKNKSYLPIEKEWEKQIWLKRWLKRQEQDKNELASQFGQEWIILLDEIPTENADIIVANLSGHKTIGKTQRQLTEHYDKDAVEVSILLLDSLAWIGKVIEKKNKTVSLFSSVYQEMLKTYDNTTKSAVITKDYLLKGFSLEEIAEFRQLKPSTINEHVIELSITDSSFDISKALPIDKLEDIRQMLRENPTSTYQEIIEKKPEILFFWYRLVQIERNRNSD